MMTRFLAMYINAREEHDVGVNDVCCGSCCSTKVSILVEDMERGTNALHGFGALFFWDEWLGKDHGEIRNIEISVMPCLEEDLVIVFLMFHGAKLPEPDRSLN